MAATRLTKDMRFRICHALMQRAYVDRNKELKLMEHELGMAVYNDIYPAKIQEQMKALPEDYFERSRTLKVAFNGDWYELHVSEPVPRAYKHYRNYSALQNYPAEHQFTEAYLKFKKLRNAYDEDVSRLREETRAILEGCTTVKKLIEAWPAVMPVLQKLDISPFQTKEEYLPAVIQDMNELFSLPPDETDNQALAA